MNPARKSISRIRNRHYKFTAPFYRDRIEPLQDFSDADIAQINLNSDEYYNKTGQQNFWRSKPLSDVDYGPSSLWRFGLLLSALGLRATDRVLDFGCGTGWTSQMMSRTGAEITCMDVSQRALTLAKDFAIQSLSAKELERIAFRIFDGKTIDAPNEYFDFIITMDAFHHLPNPVAILKEFYRVLSPHGCFGFVEPGIGHSESHTAHREAEAGILEMDLDPEKLRAAGRNIGFEELELLIPPIPPNVLTLTMPRARWYLRGIPWIVPHDYIRASILSAPIGILRKGIYSFTSLHPQGLEALIHPNITEAKAQAGSTFSLTVLVTNKAGTVWLKHGRRGVGSVQLGAHLLDPDQNMLIYDYGRAEIPRDISQFEKCSIEIQLRAPQDPGLYTIRLDMVDEGIAWFSDERSQFVDVNLLVS